MGRLSSVGVRSADVERSRTFYRKAFGLDLLDVGAAPATPGAAPANDLAATLIVEDIETAHSAVSAEGGEVIEDIGPARYGLRFLFRDPDGNVLAALQPDGSE